MKVKMKSAVRKGLMVGSVAIASAVFASLAKANTLDSLALGDHLSLTAIGVNGLGSGWPSGTPQATVNYKNVGPGPSSGTNVAAYAGQIDWTGTDITQGNESLSFLTYCVQLTTDIVVPSGVTPYTVTNLQSTLDVGNPNPAKAAEIAALIATNPSQLIAAGTTGATDSGSWEAFQVAIWDIVYNGGSDVSAGSFNVAAGLNFNLSSSQTTLISAVDADLNKILTAGVIDTSSVALTSNGGYLILSGADKGQTIFGLTGTNGTQNQSVLAIAANPGNLPGTPLPAASAGMMLLLGLTGLLGWRRKQLTCM